ncbi:MAG: GNAT family N-acetyltransferase, partial [Acutalibacteraceae bacterium]
HVEGTNSFPVGYLQGVFVKAQFRRRGIASQLLSRCEDWAREKGCTEIGSDCAMSNRESATFHLKKGFEEADRIICFAKKL